MRPNISPELKLLLSCSGLRVQRSELEGIDWELFINLAVRHRVEGVVKPALSVHSDKVTCRALKKMNSLYQENIVRTLRQLYLMQQVGRVLTEAGIDHLFVKGALLAAYYPNLSDRNAGDVDILIRSSTKLWEAVALLKKSGLQRLAPKIELNDAQAHEYLRRAKDVALYSAEYKMRVELHSRLFQNERLWTCSTENIFEVRDSRLIHGYSYPTMSKDLERLYIMLHGGLDCWFRLKWLFDAHLIFKDYNAEEFATSYQFASAYGLERPYLLCMQMLTNCFDMPMPDWIKNLAISDRAVQAMCDRSVRAICSDKVPSERNVTGFGVLVQLANGMQQQISMKPGLGHAAASIRSGMFNVRNWEVLPISQRFHFLHKPLAPLIFLIRMLRKSFNC